MTDFFFIPADGNTPRCLIHANCVEFVNWGDFELRLNFISGKNVVLTADRAKALIEQCGYGKVDELMNENAPSLDEMLE
jgi:hypothetical protein